MKFKRKVQPSIVDKQIKSKTFPPKYLNHVSAFSCYVRRRSKYNDYDAFPEHQQAFRRGELVDFELNIYLGVQVIKLIYQFKGKKFTITKPISFIEDIMTRFPFLN